MHWSVSDWVAALGVLAAWTTLFGGSMAFILRWAIRGMFQDALIGVKQEVGAMAAAVSSLDTRIKELHDYSHERFHELNGIAHRNGMAIEGLNGTLQEYRGHLMYLQKMLEFLTGSKAGGGG